MHKTIDINLGERSYAISIGEKALSSLAVFFDGIQKNMAVIISNTTVAPLYLAQVKAELSKVYQRVESVILQDGEAHKTWESLDHIFTELLRLGADRKTTLFALGGGVVGDITGFAAACYMRGIPYVQLPTTLLAQVDSSVGGKAAINHPLGKNMIGAFHQPQLVVADTSTLKTLPMRELRSGIAEVIKYGPIYDVDFLSWLEENIDDILALQGDALMFAIQRSCEIKADVVAQDEREGGVRAILNFGHTFGHAIETGAGYGKYLHGEGVAIGMVMAASLSVRMGLLSEQDAQRIKSLIIKAGLPIKSPRLGVERFIELMQRDKKSQTGEIHFVLLKGLGQAIVSTAPMDLVQAVIKDHQA